MRIQRAGCIILLKEHMKYIYRVLERRRWKDNINMNLNEMDRVGERVDKIGSGSGPEVGFSYRSAKPSGVLLECVSYFISLLDTL